MVKRVIIAGSRHFDDYAFFCAKVETCLSRIKNEYELIILSGHCFGADRMGERYAKENGFQVEVYPAEWNKYGKGAGLKRNQQMVERADFVIAFPGGGNGTRSLIEFAGKKGLPTRVIPVNI